MKRLLLRGAVLGLALWLVAPAPGAWASTTLRFYNPSDPNGSTYNEWANLAIISRTIGVNLEASGTTGLESMKVEFLGLPGWEWETLQRDPESGSYQAGSGRGTSGNPLIYYLAWNTVDPGDINRGYNGTFTLRMSADEQGPAGFSCGSSKVSCRDVKFRVNNPPSTVDWVSGPSSTKEDGRPVVSIAWSYVGNEPDMREFHIFRDGTKIATMNFAGPGTYSFDDKSYADSGYAGTHTYSVTALRTSSVGPNKCSGSGTYGTTCIGKSSGNRSVSLAEPTQSTGGGGSTPGSTPTSGSGTGGGSRGGSEPGFRPAPVGTIIVGGRQITRASSCVDCDEFYQGSYETSLPYAQDRTLLIPTRPGRQGGGNKLEAVQEENSAPLGVPIRDRSVLLPFAGGLLLFLAAAHVRRLLRRI